MSRLIATAVGFLPYFAQPSRYQATCSRALSNVRPGMASQPSAMRAARSMDTRAGADPVLDGLRRPRRDARVFDDEASLRRHGLAGEQALHEAEGFLEGRGALFDVGAHGEELRLV